MSVGGMTSFSVEDAFPEALLRGFRLGFLTDAEYHHINQCDNLNDVKMNLQETDYGNFLQNESPPLTPAVIRERALIKLVEQMEYLRANTPASGPLAKFLDYITYDYMIDNIMLILKATMNNPNVDVRELVEQTHPLGRFKASTMKSIVAFENTPQGYADLYQTVLIDTPIGRYFSQFLKEEGDKASATGSEVHSLLEEMPTTKLENTLRKLYLEDFYFFCKELGGETASIMTNLLKARADAVAISITLNSFGTTLNEPNMRQSDRKLLYPSIGHLYPEGTDRLSHVGDEEELGRAIRPYVAYRSIWEKYTENQKTIDDAMYEREVQLNEMAFESQFNYACFYSFVRLKEQEIRNLVWLCECIVQRQNDKMDQHFIPIFSLNSSWRF